MPNLPRRIASVVSTTSIALVLAGCTAAGAPASGAASGPPSELPSAAPSVAPSARPADQVDHPTGARDVVLRYEEGGGFVNPSFLLAQIPHFTLYGDGRLVFRDPSQDPPPAEGSIIRMNPARTAMLAEDQVQELLKFALGEGGLGIARARYDNNMVADASTATFTIDAGGLHKTVQVYALGMDVQGQVDAVARAQFANLAKRLTSIDAGGTIPTDVYVPTSYRGILIDSGGGVVVPDKKAWPWTDLRPADFQPDADPNGIQIPHGVMTADQVGLLGVKDFQGGLQNVALAGPSDGKTYTLSIRPLLPDETS